MPWKKGLLVIYRMSGILKKKNSWDRGARSVEPFLFLPDHYV